MRKSSIEAIIVALQTIENDIKSDDGVANSAIRETEDRLEELNAKSKRLSDEEISRYFFGPITNFGTFKAAVRAIEKAHGIGE